MNSIQITISILLALSFSISALANGSKRCLERATNNELLSEIAYRMGSSDGGEKGHVSFSAACSGSNLVINLVDLDKGTEVTDRTPMTGSGVCRELASSLNSKIGGHLESSKIIAICQGSVLKRRVLSMDGNISSLKDQPMSGSAACRSAAKEINDRL